MVHVNAKAVFICQGWQQSVRVIRLMALWLNNSPGTAGALMA